MAENCKCTHEKWLHEYDEYYNNETGDSWETWSACLEDGCDCKGYEDATDDNS
jgi:hypothetical protein